MKVVKAVSVKAVASESLLFIMIATTVVNMNAVKLIANVIPNQHCYQKFENWWPKRLISLNFCRA